ncbi:restriction endonuclease subunit S [Vibrio parahaemolyticus]|uniref:restriction endonuclease subunit S n=1 Tax=Vibrio parahaemolyticus TaxID=670 RepID=UPI00084B68A2|nr:restriction endonuclease subunit S [Vibrio parahaemolyticus]EGR3454535.1 restriction endonuclease subunit S [Vibrio parahaemolyticus]EID7759958.1 restriction endonuclease subunit S [Vibrio parahaemolyticus]MBE3868347.1 restriction endonuclease subunit S [Vibrio parahaemolyticus]MDF4430578.1 restriction endonuclease subunit S [Vibrio parahaemolyticus]MDF4449057.1 restriction endonuclease subunit S [Vibrio parahaemolyticus]
MSFEIKKATLGDFLNFKNGKKSPERADNASFPVFGSNGLIGRAESTNCPENTIVIGRVGSYCGSVHFSKEKCWVSDNAISCSSKNAGEEHFWFYVLTKLNLNQFSSGSGQPLLNQATLNAVECEVPNNSPLRALIGSVLNDYDKKIKLNAATNQTLEEMAQAIFKSWFVDFDPVKAKMNGEQPEGMDEATASLFPEKLVESELGLIPEGWEVGTLDSHTSMIIDHRGKTPKKLGSDWVEEGYPAISAKNIKSKKIVRPDTIRFIDEATYKKWMKEPLIKGDIIMTSEAPMGELYFFDGSEDFCLSQRLYGLRANSDVCSPEFLFNWLQTTKAKADMEGRASGTTALGIKQAELRKVKILTPPLELLEKYSAVASNLVDMAAKNNAQNTVLEDLRDTLLPKLLSGEIELGQAQELAEVE